MKILSSLTNRIFLATTLLAVLAVGFTVVFVGARVTSSAEAELERGLVEAGALVETHGRDMFDTFSLEARLIADIPILKATISTGDPPTARGVLSDYGRMLTKADVVAVTDRTGKVLAVAGGTEMDPAEIGRLTSVGSALEGSVATSYWSHPAGVMQLVTVPVTAGQNPPDIIGTLSVGFLLDRRLATQFKALTGSEIAFAFDGRVRASTLDPGSHAELETLLGRTGISHISMAGEQFVAVLQALPVGSSSGGSRREGAAGGGPGIASVPVAIVLRSSTERLRFLQTINQVTVLTLIVTILLATGLAYAIARTVTRPLGAITTVMREIAATGDLARKIRPPARWEDEDARLVAATFNTLTESIARFQVEVAQRERLSSLGRLSAVVAHEIRNPLMIIKASLRALGRPGVTPEALKEAVADIDGEVVRLNRVVDEVLDYAKPLRFELAPADINAICADAVEAAKAGEAEPRIEVRLDRALPMVTTDGERIRTVLVNVITNARLAVRAKAAAAERSKGVAPVDGAPIQVRTSRLDAGHVAAVVEDKGQGIDQAGLARVFEPFFTTRRGGTGLGLAIARNVINGLGGSIVIQSEPGVGTEVRIELPLAAPGPEAAPGSTFNRQR